MAGGPASARRHGRGSAWEEVSLGRRSVGAPCGTDIHLRVTKLCTAGVCQVLITALQSSVEET